MKIKFNSDDDFPLNKPLKFHAMTVIIRSLFEEDSKFYPQLFLDDTLYELSKCYRTKELMFQKELILIKQVRQKNVSFWFCKDIGFKFEEHVCNGYLDLLTID